MLKRLKVAMSANDLTQSEVCKKWEKGTAWMTPRLHGHMSFEIDQIYDLCDMLHIPYILIPVYFPKGGNDLTEKELKKYIDNLNPNAYREILPYLAMYC